MNSRPPGAEHILEGDRLHVADEPNAVSFSSSTRSGPMLLFPYSSGVEGSEYSHMRELRIQHGGRPYRVLYAFDPRSAALLLIGGDKTGQDRWYEQYVPVADRIYKAHLDEIEKEGESK